MSIDEELRALPLPSRYQGHVSICRHWWRTDRWPAERFAEDAELLGGVTPLSLGRPFCPVVSVARISSASPWPWPCWSPSADSRRTGPGRSAKPERHGRRLTGRPSQRPRSGRITWSANRRIAAAVCAAPPL